AIAFIISGAILGIMDNYHLAYIMAMLALICTQIQGQIHAQLIKDANEAADESLGIIERTIKIHQEAMDNYKSGGSDVCIIKIGKSWENEREFLRAKNEITALDMATPGM